MVKDYYKILEIEENFTEDNLKKKYRELSKKYHPDINPSGNDKFKEITEAYDILSNPEKKRQYDLGRNGNGGYDWSDAFSHFFNNSEPRAAVRDTIVKLVITPIESYNGSEKEINYSQKNPCGGCSGTGGESLVCNTCGGSGRVIKNIVNSLFTTRTAVTCHSCNGLGKTITKVCYTCNGAKTFPKLNNIKITIPVGIDGGQFLKLENLGDWNNGHFGNLILQIDVDNSKDFQKINNDLVYNLFLDDMQICAEKYTVPHPKGDLSINALDVFDTSKPLRMAGKGYFGGDFYVNLHVKFKRN